MSTGGLLFFQIYHHFTDSDFSTTLALQWKTKASPSIIRFSLIRRTNFKSLSINNRHQVKQISKSELKRNKIQNWLACWHHLLPKEVLSFSLAFPMMSGKISLSNMLIHHFPLTEIIYTLGWGERVPKEFLSCSTVYSCATMNDASFIGFWMLCRKKHHVNWALIVKAFFHTCFVNSGIINSSLQKKPPTT